jgi:acetylornithine deacetylase/succinyl-diaminopimelate desuccinylase-like protein
MAPVDLLRDLLRARTINPPGDETAAAAVLEAYLSEAGLKTEILDSPGGRSSLIARLDGPHDRPALVLLSHSDVVAVEEESWTRDPFGGELVDGFIWGRGALDMKSIAVMHAVAVSGLVRSGRTPTREVIVVMAADEEAGGGEGARWLVEEHPNTVGFGEGRPPPEVVTEGAYGLAGLLDRPVMPIALGEKTAVWFDLVAKGDPGHGALPPEQQAPVNLATLIGEIAGFGIPRVHPVMRQQFSTLTSAASGKRAAVFRALASPAGGVLARAIAPQLRKAGALGLLLSDTVTPTQVAAGYKSNVVPAEARASFDCRLLPDTDVEEFIASVDKKARRRGGLVANVEQKGHGPVSVEGPLFEILENASRELVPNVVTAVSLSPGITDARFFRSRGATAYGWCPLMLTPELLATIHGNDERIGLEDFNKAVSATTDVVVRASS